MSSSTSQTPRKLALAGFLVCAGLIGFALYLQYFDNQEPCPLCMIQRLSYFALGIVFLAAALHAPGRIGVRVYGILALIAAVVGAGFAARHVWLQWHPPAMESCTADLFFQLKKFPAFDVIGRALRATGDCAKVDWTFLHLSMAEWSLMWFVLLALLAMAYFLRAPRPASRWF